MKISELQENDRATLFNICPKYNLNYKFSGIVEKSKDGRLWLTDQKGHGYIVDEKFNYLWDVKKI